ncbi:nucleotide exchange factor GrpE [Cryobacterium sinapicolor]|uniref:Protein GrpE n=1 Tax=Cryobacterium sinapicolor TaxID=1259236 RepID=A0ABY2JEC9_9MICO|nr:MULTISPECIES: nucleotide exchange factor GrpE [Cryobacterium]TFC84446.1 nucleotide exchange factor GrpE [Cryobacterium sp. TMT3-29-2]TFD03920.1 nucleotide exchange factor GrpE [Cryobacterium sinapicolor]
MADDTKRPEDEPFEEGASAEGAPGAAADAEAVSGEDTEEASAEGIEEDELTVQDILDAAAREVDEPTSEHLADLKRVTAEYANYRRRTEANREVERERVTVDVVKGLIPVLDDLDRAEKHGDLVDDSAFSTIAAKLRASVERLGVRSFGTVGEPFDPTVHEAIFQLPTAGIESETVGDVIETGYFLGSSLLRVAKVVVQVPSDG